MRCPLICVVSDVLRGERSVMESGLSPGMEVNENFVLLRRPAIPLWWDSKTRPHVAVVMSDPETGKEFRYYLSQAPKKGHNGRPQLEVIDIDSFAADLPEGTELEVKYNALRANLYKLELVDGVPCWRWVRKYEGLHDL